jgi:TolB-like protein/DNA-binding winged helix-turn-helix (wHTH) protein/Flp pilus assembly protein TadD
LAQSLTPMDAPSPHVIRFGVFELDTTSGELRKHNRRIRLPEQSFQVLELLLTHAGEVVTRDDLRNRLWPSAAAGDFDAGLNNAIRKLRDALGDSAETPRFIETLPRRGYRFVAGREAAVPTSSVGLADASVPVPKRRRSWMGAGRPALLAALVLVSGYVVWRLTGSGRLATPAAQVRSLAVLPFENLTGDAGQEYFVDGVTEAVTTSLAQIHALRVISRTSAMRYRNTQKSLRDVARELNVDAIVEGAVLRSGARVRITAQLIDSRTDSHLWAQSYDRALPDVLALQAEVAGAIADAVHAEVRPEERRRLERVRAAHPDAYDDYLKGRFSWSHPSPENLLKAATHFNRAIERDAAYAPAYSGLSDTYRLFDVYGLAAPRESMPKAEAAARKALALDDTLAEAHASLAGVLYRYHWDWDGARREFERSLALDPNYAEGHRARTVYLLTQRRLTDALAAADRAETLSPLSPLIRTERATTLWRLGRLDDARAQLHRVLEIDPDFSRAHVELGILAIRNREFGPGVVEIERGIAKTPGRGQLPWLGYAYGRAGRVADALQILAELEKTSQERFISPQSFSVVHLGLGQRAEARRWLEQAFDERAVEVLGFSGVVFDQLQAEPRFRVLLGRMGLAQEQGYAAGPPAT